MNDMSERVKEGAVMKKLIGRNVLMVIAKNKFRDEEYFEPRKVLESEGARVIVASSSLDLAVGMLGLKVKPDVLISAVKEPDYDGIVFVGGSGAREYFDSPVAQALARSFCSHGKLTSAICIAPAILANAGLLKEKKATSFPSSEETLKLKGAAFTMDDVVVDGKIITGVGPEAAKRFGEKLVEVLSRT
jgi:protease I